jgi:farnesyl-diphosphate farnesyltransferase
MRIDEVFAALWFKYGATLPNKLERRDESMLFCDDMLGKVSRSFAAVIRQLPKGLCADILIFYLVLRALDTIEDDMEAFKGKEEKKIQHLNTFYQVIGKEGWTMSGVGEGDERVLLEQYHHCVTVFRSLSPESQEVIADITKRMGEGMASFSKIDLGQGTVSVDDYNHYCHFVAGLVGEGLSRLFTCCGYEAQKVADVSKTLANTMGLFLQKTNIIRDYLEDYVDGRAFWPQEIWKKYSITGDLGDFAKAGNIQKAVFCLNDLITDALECVPECLEYMKLLKTEEVFRFCAIPQVMAIATLPELYNNPNVFTGVVKIRKGQAAKLLLDTKTMDGLHKWFFIFARDIKRRIPANDLSAKRTHAICDEIIDLTEALGAQAIALSYGLVFNSISPVIIAVSSHFLFKRSFRTGEFSFIFADFEGLSEWDLFTASALLFAVTYTLFYSIIAAKRPKLRRADP